MKVIRLNSNQHEKILPVRHLSARVPWHDNKWNGNTCCNVLDNSFCRILPLVDKKKDLENEPSNCKIVDGNFPPCISEKGTFLSPNEYTRELNHAFKEVNNKLFANFGPAKYHHKPYSFNAVPFFWMMKSTAHPNLNFNPDDRPHISIKAVQYEVNYQVEREEQIDRQLGFEGNIWVQDADNQKALLDTFFGCLQPQKSLIFFYAKHTPLSEPNERIIVGVAKVRKAPGNILEYSFPKGYSGHKSYVWDRCIEHSLRPDGSEGFLLPYHEILEYVNKNNVEVELNDYVAVAPDFAQFSYASELVEHDTAIDALLNVAESLRKSRSLLQKSFQDELNWVDSEISKIWDMRGAFPGMGPVLSALGVESGNTIAWEIEKYILNKTGDLLEINPWDIFEASITQPEKYLGNRGNKLFTKTIQTKWKNKPPAKKQFYKFLSRCQLTNEQAQFLITKFAHTIDRVLNNPYLLYETTRFEQFGIAFQQIDKALFPPEKIKTSFPLDEGVDIEDQLDERRVRALSVLQLESAAAVDGHSLLPFDELLNRLMKKQLDEPFPIDEDTLEAQAFTDFFAEEIVIIPKSAENETVFLKLARLQQVKAIIGKRINPKDILSSAYNIEHNWLDIINESFKDASSNSSNSSNNKKDIDQDESESRYEKAEALRILTNSRFSVLIGPAGSGKTTLLKTFEKLPEISQGGVLKLAPTGKARVKLASDAKTVAQFLYSLKRYNPSTGTYFPNETAKYSGARNIIIDESSMLTEEQLAALLDALGPVDRIILVGDHRQLPPIGTGRPFFDIAKKLEPSVFDSIPLTGEESFQPRTGPAYAELTKIWRQSKSGDKRWDVQLSRCFTDNVEKHDIDVFRQLSSGEIQSKHIRLEKWYSSDDFRELFRSVLEKELLDPDQLEKSFNRTIGAKDDGDFQYFNRGDAEKFIENWQVLSPVNGYGFGVKEINKFVQTSYRKRFIDLALSKLRKVAKPKGSDNVVYGDKVINLKNSVWESWQEIKPREKKASALNYIANGEIGIITGEFKPYSDGEPNIEITFSTQPGYSYVFKPKQLGEDSRHSVELAYAITVHKAQGSGFKIVFFVLPSKGSILSRELLYTALTRQEDKIIILHQGDFKDFIRFASTDASATARRFTDLYYLPDVKQLEHKFYDAKYINISERGEPMISKNEVIIANLLNKYKDDIHYSYEEKLKFEDTGRIIKPDFEIENIATRKKYYWEHLGLMTQKKYREDWSKKLKAYEKDGFVFYEKAQPSDEKVLIVTEENPNGGINSQEIDDIIQTVILKS